MSSAVTSAAGEPIVGARNGSGNRSRTADPLASSGDLRSHAPGQLARQRAEAEWQQVKDRSKWRAYLGRAIGARTDERAWRVGATGEEIIGRRPTQRLTPAGWLVLHSVQLGLGDCDIDHVLIGPAGVFTVNSKHHPKGRVTVYSRTVYVSGTQQPYLAKSRAEAGRAGRLLTSAVGWTVPVRPVLAILAQVVRIKHGGPDDVLIWRSRFGKQLLKTEPRLTASQLAQLTEVAVLPSTWRHQPVTVSPGPPRPRAGRPAWELTASWTMR